MTTRRGQEIAHAVHELHNKGIKPTSRNVLAHITGRPHTDFPHGMGGNDVLYLRRAMLDLGWSLPKSGTEWVTPEGWVAAPKPKRSKKAVGLDEVLCTDRTCPARVLSQHTLAVHEVFALQ